MKKVPGVAFYGKVRIPTRGHATAINVGKDIAKKTGGKLTIGLSGTAEPLDIPTKKSLAEKTFGHPVDVGTDHTRTLAHFLTHLNKSHDELHLVAGSDRVEEYKRFLDRYNGKKDSKGKVIFNFKKYTVYPAGGKRVESNKDPREMTDDELTSSVSASKLEQLAKDGNYEHFAAYHRGMPQSQIRRVFSMIRKHHRLNEEANIGLTFARKEMPQIGASRSFIKYLKDNDISAQRTKINPDNLRSSQMEFDDDKINGLRDNPSDNPIIVSKDMHVVDGHHRWLADQLEGRDCDAYVCDLTILDLMYHAKHYSKNLCEDVSRKELAPMLDSFVSFASDKLGIKSVPAVRYKTDDDDYNSFAAYNPSSNELSVHTKNRHPMDVFRSVAHELVHHKQNEDGRIGKDIAREGKTGSDIENEANAEAGKIMRWFAKTNPHMFAKTHIVEETLHEGINDPGKLKAIFLAGGPGSGKDYVMNSVLNGEGLREINSDIAFEFLMQKNNLDMEMPDAEREKRDIVRGRAKNITKEQQRLALAGRLGLIINGTADDMQKIRDVKGKLEDMGYETMMVFVNTSDEVSRQRNVERGKMGKRKVPDGTDKQGIPDSSPNIRKDKWDAAQKNIGTLQTIFGKEKFTVIDNTLDARKATPEEKEKVQAQFSHVRRMAQQFVRAENKNPKASEWISKEAEKRGITDYKSSKSYAPVNKSQSSTASNKPDNETMAQARRLGLSYYGFGRFGRKVNGKNTVLYTSNNGKLKKTVNEELSLDESFKSYMTDPANREFGTDSLANIYKQNTPGQSDTIKKKKLVVKKKLAQEDRSPMPSLPNADGIGPEITQYRPMTTFGFTYGISESIAAWVNNPKTQAKFIQKYGTLAEQKLAEAAKTLEASGCGFNHSEKKSVSSIKENWEALGGRDMGTVPTQRKNEIAEKKLTPAEMAKREDVVKALKRKGMKKDKAYPIATAQAKRIAEAIDKAAMSCNKPRAQSHGSGETGKSHVVKACSGGQEKIIRFGQKGVKGSPKKEGESKAYASRRKRFKTRHAKNIAKGKMSAAYWANKVKW